MDLLTEDISLVQTVCSDDYSVFSDLYTTLC